MQINYSTDAFDSLIHLINFIESKNTKGAGIRWLNKYEVFLKKKLKTAQQIKLCNNETFHRLNLHCIHYHDWVIAFSIHNKDVLIEAILHKSRIND